MRLIVASPADLPEVLGELGTRVGPRIGANARTQDEKEWWCFRRYLVTVASIGQIAFPISIMKSESPDFRCEFGTRSVGVEVTEATDPRDQRELTRIDQQDEVVLRGSLGGRFPNGAGGDAPERTWREDISKAVAAKMKKLPSWPDPMPQYELLLYTNSNAGSLIFDWPRAFGEVGPLNDQLWGEQLRSTAVTAVSVICSQWLLRLQPDSVNWHPLRSGIEEEDRELASLT
jgi:hypothetical protein